MAPTPNMGLVLPVDGGSNNVWNVILDQVFTQIDSHNHTPGQGALITSAGLGIATDLTFGGNSAINLKANVFTAQAVGAVAAYANALFTNSADNNLYFRNLGGQNVQLTAGNSAYGAGARTLLVPPTAARNTAGGASTVVPATMSITLSTDVNPIAYPCPIEAGQTITSWKLYLNKTTAGGNTVSAQLQRISAAGVLTNIGAAATNNANNPGFISLSIAGLNELTAGGAAYQVALTGSGVAGDVAYDLDLGYTR